MDLSAWRVASCRGFVGLPDTLGPQRGAQIGRQ